MINHSTLAHFGAIFSPLFSSFVPAGIYLGDEITVTLLVRRLPSQPRGNWKNRFDKKLASGLVSGRKLMGFFFAEPAVGEVGK